MREWHRWRQFVHIALLLEIAQSASVLGLVINLGLAHQHKSSSFPPQNDTPLSVVENKHTLRRPVAVAMGAQRSQNTPALILFDIDGTLCDSFNLGFTCTNSVLEHNGHSNVTSEEYHYGTRWSTPERLARHCNLDPTRDEEAFKETGHRLGKEFDELYIGKVDTESTRLHDGMDCLLHDSIRKGCLVGALSNAAVAYVKKVLEVHELDSMFSVAHGADDVAAPKPNPDGLLQCCSELNLTAEDAIYIGDSPSDGLAARAANMKSIGVSWGSHSKESLMSSFDEVVDSMSELRKFLNLGKAQEARQWDASYPGQQRA